MKCKFLLVTLFSFAMAVGANAQDYPEMYLRGEMCNPIWGVQQNLKFERNDNIYHLTVPSLLGKFKVSNDDWTVNFGGEGDITIAGDDLLVGWHDGDNLIGAYDGDITISFSYTPGANAAPLMFSTTGNIITNEKPKPGSGTLPLLYINVYDEQGNPNNEILSKDLAHKEYFTGEYWLDANGCTWMEGAKDIGSGDEPLPLEIKARGNWTRIGFSKKPFKLKLGKKQSLLGMTKSKHYAILAHADDSYGYMRNFTGFALGKRIGLPWTPSQQPVEVIINGDYRGLYFLTESIRVGDDRVMIEPLDDNATDSNLISGGYLVELDNYDEENQIRMEEKGDGSYYKDMLRVTFDTPELYSDLQKRFVTDQFTAMNDLVGENSDRLWSYIDLDDAARYYIVEEIISHVESYHGSTYMFRDRGEGEKWHFSPLWDCGNAFVGPVNDYFYNHAPYGCTWIASFRLNDKFNEKVKETWKWFMSNCYPGLEKELQEYAESLKAAARADVQRWDGKPWPAGGMPVVNNSDMDAKLATVLNHLRSKTSWLKGEFGDYSNGLYAEPERDATKAAALPEYALPTSVVTVGGEIDGNAEYYTLQGMRAAYPENGGIYIKVQNGQGAKILIP